MEISCTQAFKDYAALPGKRSLRKLHQKYAEEQKLSPSLDTLKNWSRKYDWQNKVCEIDQKQYEKMARIKPKNFLRKIEKDPDLVLLMVMDICYNHTDLLKPGDEKLSKMSGFRALRLIDRCLTIFHNINYTALLSNKKGRNFITTNNIKPLKLR